VCGLLVGRSEWHDRGMRSSLGEANGGVLARRFDRLFFLYFAVVDMHMHEFSNPINQSIKIITTKEHRGL
jgi:hypothetical protein